MPDHQNSQANRPMIYEIKLEGHLSPAWEAEFEGLTITLLDTGETLLRGSVIDQAALHGVFKKIRDLGLPLIAVTRLPSEPTDEADNQD